MGAKTNGKQTTDSNVKYFRDFPNDAGFADIPETRTPIELKVTGNIPNYVRGVLYRTGPGMYTTPMNNGQIFKVQHWYSSLIPLY
jgi:torulene dioxygenase